MYVEPDEATTYRGCAVQARLGALETSCPKLKLILEKLAISYEARAAAFERAQQHELRKAS